MTNPTSNFGWQMPTSTDLVTDLPADFEVFGQAVDTDFVDLLGGANGYILSKASATDLDFAWIPNDQGDITAVNVTAPITGGGTSGSVGIAISSASTAASGAVQLSDSTSTTSSVLAATPTAVKAAYDLANGAIAKTTVTTAGDIIYRNATVPARLGIGTAGQVLTVNSGATAPEWATAASGGMTLISTTAITATASVDLTSIPGTYNELLIVVDGAFENAGSAQTLTFNNATSLFSYAYQQASNANTVLVSTSAGSIALCGSLRFPAGSGSGSIAIRIPRYASSTMAKTLGWTASSGNGATAGGGSWAAIATITSAKITWAGTPTAQGNVYLYGVK
jgi:hypothetical protein